MSFDYPPGMMVFATRRKGALLLAALLLAGTSSCQSLTGPEKEREEGRKALAAARRIWSAQALSSYDYRYQRLCFCLPDARARVIVSVRSGRVTGALRVEEGTPVDAATARERYQTVEGLFALIEAAYADGSEVVEAGYDPGRGYPTSLFIDRSTRIADEEVRIETSNLEPR